MSKYKLRYSADDEAKKWPLDCNRCGSSAPLTETDWDDLGTPQDQIPKDRAPMERLCVFCYETHLGSLLKYRHNREHAPIARALCQALNIMLREREKGADGR